MRSRSLEYLVTLDSLPVLNSDDECRLQEGPVGFGKGYYAVVVGPPSSMVCAERSSTWQLWHPSLEAALDTHCSEQSSVARIAGALNMLITKMREGCYELHRSTSSHQGSLQLVSRYAASCALRRRLYTGSSRADVFFEWPLFLPEFDNDETRDHKTLDHEITDLCDSPVYIGFVSVEVPQGDEGIPLSPSESLESALFTRWERLSHEVKCTGANSYTKRQINYLSRVATELVKCKRSIVYESHSTFRANLIQATSVNLQSMEDLIHIMAIILDQARDIYLNNIRNRSKEFDRDLTIYRSKKWSKLRDYYDASSACLIDAVRRDRDVIWGEPNLMANVLHWLYKGARDDKRYLGPVLKPYLDELFTSSMENCWFLDDFDSNQCDTEFLGLQEYCAGVHEGTVEPCTGLLDAAKTFGWAKALVDFVDRHKFVDFRLVFPTGDGLAVSYPLRLRSQHEPGAARLLTLTRADKEQAKLRLATRCVLHAFHDAFIGKRFQTKELHGSTDEILAKVKTGSFWRTSKPDIIPSPSSEPRRRPATVYGFPEISITSHSDTKTLRRKYHTLRSLVYKEQVDVKAMRQRPRSACSTVRSKQSLSRPKLLETLDFITGVKDAFSVEESGASDVEDNCWRVEDEWVTSQVAPLNFITSRDSSRAMLPPG
ncbi:unnamed protein product [Leptidea sinapis]|uniref:Uncharacterized protein n=1 Tax=Leptidea sinapis TaxID=189913 RepID=A0A5E4Q1K7_9NEOP|nr:unnamed protein product [Leptidea sinapis]